MIMALNPLANPKGVKLCCELCSKPAFIVCTKCRVTYYCDTEHQNIDWIGIHEKICQHLIALRTPVPFISGSEEQREHQKQQQTTRQKQMIELTRTCGQKLLFESQYEYSIPAAMQSLKFSIEVYGLASIELVPSYLILGEACIGLGRLSQAEEYLSQAQWTVMKTPECKNDIKSRLHRNLGMLYATQENYDDALKHLAEDIYHASCAFGTDDIRTSGGYFHMANIFHKQNKLDVAFSLFTKLIGIWFNHLEVLVQQRTRKPTPPKGIGPAQFITADDEFDILDEAQGAEAVHILHSILQIREKQSSSTPTIMSKIYFTLALLYVVLENYDLARDFGEKGLTSAKKGLSTDEEQIKLLTALQQSIQRLQQKVK